MWKIKLFIRHQSVSSTSFLLTRIYSESLNNGRFVLTQQYDSSSESENDIEIHQHDAEEKKKIRRKHHWVRDQSFSDDEQAQVTIKNGNKDDHEK